MVAIAMNYKDGQQTQRTYYKNYILLGTDTI